MLLNKTDDLVTANADKGLVIFKIFTSVFNNKISHTFVLKYRVQRGEDFNFTMDKSRW